ncbi:hypothetical protein ACOMHN_051725 [Nucella lapillus]
MMEQVMARRCDYGYGAFSEGNKPFTKTPKVITTLTRFTAAVVKQPESTRTDCLGFDQYVSQVTKESFTISVFSLTGGAPELRKVYCNWEACQ